MSMVQIYLYEFSGLYNYNNYTPGTGTHAFSITSFGEDSSHFLHYNSILFVQPADRVSIE